MEATIRLDEPNLKIIPHDNPNLQHTYLEIESYASSEVGSGILNKQFVHGTPEQLLAIANVIQETWGKKGIELPQPSADDEGFEEMVRVHESHNYTPEPEVRDERIAS